MTDQFDLQKAITEIGQSTSEAITAIKSKEGKMDEQFTKLAADSADAVQKYNDLKAKYDESEKWRSDFEKRLVRPVSGNGDSDGISLEYSKVFDKAIRNPYRGAGQAEIDVDLQASHKYIDYYIAKNFPHLEQNQQLRVKKDMLEGDDPRGGYWIIPERSSQIITRVLETSPMRQVATVATTMVDNMQMIIDDQWAASGGWVGETEARPNTSTPQIGLADFPVYELYASVPATQRIVDDVSFDMQNWLVNKTTYRMTLDQNTAFVVGDGSKKPRGILDYPAWTGSSVVIGDDDNYERGALEYIISGIDGEPTYEGLANTKSALLENYQPNATWFMHRTTWGAILRLVSTTDFPLIAPQTMLQQGVPEILMGRPVMFASDVPQAATDSKSIIYGDFREGYTIVDRIGYRTIRDNVTQKPYILYYTTVRVGGALSSYQSLKVNIFSATTGPVTMGVPQSLVLSREAKARQVREAEFRIKKEVEKIKESRSGVKK